MRRHAWHGAFGHVRRHQDAALEYLDKISLVADERKEADRLIARLNSRVARRRTKRHSGESQIRAQQPRRQVDLAQTLAGVEKYEEALKEFNIGQDRRAFQTTARASDDSDFEC